MTNPKGEHTVALRIGRPPRLVGLAVGKAIPVARYSTIALVSDCHLNEFFACLIFIHSAKRLRPFESAASRQPTTRVFLSEND